MPITTQEGTTTIVRPTEEEMLKQSIKQYGGSTSINNEDKLYNAYLEKRANAAAIAAISGDYSAMQYFEDVDNGTASIDQNFMIQLQGGTLSSLEKEEDEESNE